ncbi:MAG: hypothetical protein JW956_00225 [Calditrichaceae bacterium]|nr:hypothetical protein [Calditrichaceae bacterium]
MRIIKYFRFLIFFGIIIGLFYLISCSEGTNPNDKKFVLPEKDLSFYEHIEPLFNIRCGMESGCHSPTDISNPFTYNDLTILEALKNYRLSNNDYRLIELEVDQLNPQSSILYLILSEGFPDYKDLMPPFPKDRLTTNQLNGIKQWIREGAPE